MVQVQPAGAGSRSVGDILRERRKKSAHYLGILCLVSGMLISLTGMSEPGITWRHFVGISCVVAGTCLVLLAGPEVSGRPCAPANVAFSAAKVEEFLDKHTLELVQAAPISAAVCPICLDDLADENQVCELDCRHQFHRDCMRKLLSTAGRVALKCPVCRERCRVNASVALGRAVASAHS